MKCHFGALTCIYYIPILQWGNWATVKVLEWLPFSLNILALHHSLIVILHWGVSFVFGCSWDLLLSLIVCDMSKCGPVESLKPDVHLSTLYCFGKVSAIASEYCLLPFSLSLPSRIMIEHALRSLFYLPFLLILLYGVLLFLSQSRFAFLFTILSVFTSV